MPIVIARTSYFLAKLFKCSSLEDISWPIREKGLPAEGVGERLYSRLYWLSSSVNCESFAADTSFSFNH